MSRTALTLTLILSVLKLTAQEIITDRPDQTESSTTIPKGSFQVESGLLFGNYDTEGGSERLILAPTALLRYSLTRFIEIRLVEQLVYLKNENTSQGYFGLSDLEFGTKIQILKKETVNSEIAFISHLVLPTGANGITNKHAGTVNKLAISHVLNDFLDLGYNVGYNYFGTGKGDFTYSIALGFGLSNKFGAYIEPFGEITDFDDWVSNFDAGITYLIQENMQLDFSFGVGLNRKMNFIAVGFSWNIGNKEKT